jgi:hypothetical protein
MRLSNTEPHAVRPILGALDPTGQNYHYGSRANDLRRGGDIDAHLDASRPIDIKTQLNTQYHLELAHIVEEAHFVLVSFEEISANLTRKGFVS